MWKRNDVQKLSIERTKLKYSGLNNHKILKLLLVSVYLMSLKIFAQAIL